MAPTEPAEGGSIFGRVDIGVVVPGDSLEQHGSRVAVLVPASVVGTGVAASGIVGGRQAAVGADQGLGESVGSAVDVVTLDGDDLCGSGLEAVIALAISASSLMRQKSDEDVLCSHIEFHESLDRSSSFIVTGSNCLRTKETGFLARIEVDLDWGGGFEARGDQGTEDLHGIDGPGAILTRRNSVSITVIKCDLEQNPHRQRLGHARSLESSC